MSRFTFATWLLSFAGALPMVACSSQSPVAPSDAVGTAPSVGVAAANAATASTAARALPGTYTLTFHDHTGAEVVSLPVLSDELILKAHVSDSSGQPAQSGSVTFEYCSYRGLPPNDITRADEAPMSACLEGGTGRWRSMVMTSVNQSGEAGMDFGIVRIPRFVGFRFQYKGGSTSGIANGQSEPRDFEWTAS
jgi:hypothetical protein